MKVHRDLVIRLDDLPKETLDLFKAICSNDKIPNMVWRSIGPIDNNLSWKTNRDILGESIRRRRP